MFGRGVLQVISCRCDLSWIQVAAPLRGHMKARQNCIKNILNPRLAISVKADSEAAPRC